MNTYIFHSVNSAIYLGNAISGILIDGIHDGPADGMSYMPSVMQKQLADGLGVFAHTDVLLFTHVHSDHFQQDGVSRFVSHKKLLNVYGPGVKKTNVEVEEAEPGIYRLATRQGVIYGVEMPHDGSKRFHIPHQGYLIHLNQESFFHCGDAVLSGEAGEKILKYCPNGLDAIFVNIYQLYAEGGREFFRLLKPKRIFLIHLPNESDDVLNYHALAKQVINKYKGEIVMPELLQHLSWVDRKCPYWGNI